MGKNLVGVGSWGPRRVLGIKGWGSGDDAILGAKEGSGTGVGFWGRESLL